MHTLVVGAPVWETLDPLRTRSHWTIANATTKAVSFNGRTCYRPQRSCGQGNIFTPLCHSVDRGGRVKGSVRGEGGVHGKGGHAWQRGACMAKGDVRGKGGMCGKRGACMARGVCAMHPPDTTRYSRSMRGRYASYWNAYLFLDTMTWILNLVTFDLKPWFCWKKVQLNE